MPDTENASLLEAAIHGTVVIPLVGRTHLEINGADRASFLHNFCTNHIKGLASGQGCEAFITNVKGRILGHVMIYAGTESLFIETVPGQAASLLNHLDKYIITEDVQLADRSEDWSQIYVSGAGVEALLQSSLSPGITQSGPGICQIACGTGFLRRFAFGSSPGWSLAGPAAQVKDWESDLLSRGAKLGTEEVFEQLRIEVGFPLYGVDITEDNLAQEANRTRQAISFNKGCYLGQEPIARLDSMGHVNRSLCQVVIHRADSLTAGSDVFASPDSVEASGHVTSAAVWPLTGQSLGLGLLRRELARDQHLCYIGPERIPGIVRVRAG